MHRSKLKLTFIFHYKCFILPQMNVVLHFCWLFYHAAPAKVTRDETGRAANDVNNRHNFQQSDGPGLDERLKPDEM